MPRSDNIIDLDDFPKGTNFRTINNTSLIGEGNINLQEPLISGTNIKSINTASLLGSGNVAVQPTLVSGTNIKTINNTSILGSGNLTISANALPTGSLLMWAGSTAPTGFLQCDGSAISRTTYSDLFNVIGTLYGAGDSSTTFNLPNFIDRFPQSFGSYAGAVGTLHAQQLPNIRAYNIGKINPPNPTSGATYASQNDRYTGGTDYAGWIISFAASNYDGTYQDNARVQPYSVVVNFCIKY